MNATHSLLAAALISSLALGASTAEAQTEQRTDDAWAQAQVQAEAPEVQLQAPQVQAPPVREMRRFFLEGNIGGGFLVGNTDYLPGGNPGNWSYPIVYGWSFGATGGYMLSENIGLFGSYVHSRNETRDGQINGLVDRIEGRLNYNSAAAGIRLMLPTGFGALRGDFGVAMIFPHSRVLHYEYGPGLPQIGLDVEGTGRRIENYSVGVGAQARIGYQIPLFGPFYAAADAELQIFQTENSGESTVYENFVDFEAATPRVRNETVLHAEGAAQPEAQSVQSIRLMFAIGAQF